MRIPFYSYLDINYSNTSMLIDFGRNGADKSGLFCVLWTVFERMKEDNEVAVADTVKMMRVRRPQIIPTLVMLILSKSG